MLNKTVREQSHAAELCLFIFDSLIILDNLEKAENFHLIFLVKLSKYLGFGPFAKAELGALLLSADEEEVLDLLLTCDYGSVVHMTNEQRRNFLDAFIKFYSSHVDGMGVIKSVQVLREVLN
jgi:DNA repair protein RecO (recombination protein O)